MEKIHLHGPLYSSYFVTSRQPTAIVFVFIYSSKSFSNSSHVNCDMNVLRHGIRNLHILAGVDYIF